MDQVEHVRRLYQLLIMFGSVLLVLAGVSLSAAGLASYQADAFIRHWRGEGVEPPSIEWRIAAAAARRAVSLYPVPNGEYLDRLGGVSSWKDFRRDFGDDFASPERKAAISFYRSSIRYRPSHPNTYARLATAKLRQLELDEEFFIALGKADRLGRGSLEVALEVSEAGLLAWPVLDDGARAAVVSSSRRILASDVDASVIASLALKAGALPFICEGATSDLSGLSNCRPEKVGAIGSPHAKLDARSHGDIIEKR